MIFLDLDALLQVAQQALGTAAVVRDHGLLPAIAEELQRGTVPRR